MKNNKFFAVLAAAIFCVGLMLASGCARKSGDVSNGDTKAAAVKYTCPMHPDVISDKPGKCPNCGMDLVEKK